jgi:hypothetical protein
MGMVYYRLTVEAMRPLTDLIAQHEADVLGPRARGYWVDEPDEYDHAEVRGVAQALDRAGRDAATERLELSEVQAHALSMLEFELPQDEAAFAPTLFSTSAMPAQVQLRMELARRRLGKTPERVAAQFVSDERDKRFAGYLKKQMRHLREALPLVWRFYERAAEAGEAILVVDLRARDLEIPDKVESAHAY